MVGLWQFACLSVATAGGLLACSCPAWPHQHQSDIGHVGAGGASLDEAASGGQQWVGITAVDCTFQCYRLPAEPGGDG